MTTYARIESGMVMELFSTTADITTLFHPSLVWVVCPVNVAVGWSYVGGVFTAPPAPPVPTVADAQVEQITKMYAAYEKAISQDVSFTTATGVLKTYQADPDSVSNAQKVLAAFTTSGVPVGFYWLAKDNTQVPFTLVDLQGFAKVMGNQGWTAFQNLQNRKASILAATTIAAVQAVVW